MSEFSELQPYQMVTQAAAASGGFTLKPGNSHGSTTQCMTKYEMTSKYMMDESRLTGYGTNQLVPKLDWVSGGGPAGVWVISLYGYYSQLEACHSVNPNTQTVYSSSATFGGVLYTTPTLTPGTEFNGTNYYYKWNNDKNWALILTNGFVDDYDICYPNQWLFTGAYATNDVCGQTNFPNYFYTKASDYYLTTGVIVYNDPDLLSPVNGSNYYYKNYGDSYDFPSGRWQISPSGVITQISGCPLPHGFSPAEDSVYDACNTNYPNYVTYYSYNYLPQDGGGLIYIDAGGTILLNGDFRYYKNENTVYYIDNTGDAAYISSC